MARSNLSGSGDNRFNSAAGSVPATAAPLTMACWFRAVDPTVGNQTLVNLRLNTSSGDHRFTLTTQSTAKLLLLARDTAFGIASTVNLISADTWSHVVGIFTSSTDRRAVLNGDWANSGVNVTDITPVGVNQTQVVIVGTSTNPLKGEIAEVAVWTAALTQAEVELLATGASPRRVRPASLAFYAPMRSGDANGNELDLIGGILLTEDGTMGISAHPPDVLLRAGRLLYD